MQQKRLEEVTIGVFRPCCDNPHAFPDCNHGMAMLGLLELMARDASVDEMSSRERSQRFLVSAAGCRAGDFIQRDKKRRFR
jgi:hypothetical protein